MSAATADRNTPVLGDGGLTQTNAYQVAASTVIYKGCLCSLNSSGYLVMSSDTASTKCVGVAAAHVDNSTGSAGAVTANVLSGVFRFAQTGTAITIANIGTKANVADNQTVELTTTNSIEVGVIQNVDTSGVWVYAGLPAW